MSHSTSKKLGEIIRLEYGKSLPGSQRDGSGSYLVVGSNGTQGFHTQALVKAPGIVVGRKGSAGQVNMYDHDFWPIDTTYYVVQKADLNLKWLYHALKSLPLSKLVTATGVPGLNRNDVYELSIHVPPLAEQRRIVRILDEVDGLRRLRAEAERRTADLTSSIFHQMFPVAGINAQDLTDATIEELAEDRNDRIRTGPFGSDLLHSEFTSEGIPALGIDNVVANEFRWTMARCIPESKYDNFKRFRVFPGDVLVTIMGTVGRCAYAPENLPLCISTKHLCVITPDRSRILPEYLWASILYDETVRQQTRIAGAGAIMEGWNSTIIRNLRIRIPSLERQRAFTARFAEVERLKTGQAISRQRLDDLFQSLLQRAFQGEL